VRLLREITLILFIAASGSTAFYYGVSPSPRSGLPVNILDIDKAGVPADEWFERQRAFPFDEIPQDRYLAAREYVASRMSFSMPSGTAWELAGPTNIEGRVTALAINPSDPAVVYAGCANGGVWKSTDFCRTWTSVFDNQSTSSIGDLAIDPQNPAVLYAGTGEQNSLRSYYPGTGVYKSTDGGASWNLAGLDSSYSIGRIAINPMNPAELYVAAMGSLRRPTQQRGVYKSTDAGATWARVLFVADSVGAIDVVLDPSNPAKVFAAMWERTRREDYIKYGGPASALYMSVDGGTNWSVVGGGFPSNQPTLGRVSLDIAASNPQVVYALTAYADGTSRGLYRSSNGGNNWQFVNASVAWSSSYAWFNRICRVNPSNPDQVYCGGLEMERSNNAGGSFTTIASSHVDQHAAAFSSSDPSYVVIGNDGGVDYSTNGGASWGYSTSLPVTQFYAGEVDPGNPAVLLGGTQDNGTVRTLSGGTNDWQDIYGGDGFYCRVDYTNPQRVYASSQYGGLGRSTNGGATFLGGTSGLDLTYTNWMTPYVLDKNNPLVLYCGTYKIHRSTNGMQSWTAISPDLAKRHVQLLGTITTLDVAASDPNVIYCGTDDANVWVTKNGGTSWTPVNNGLPERWVTRVAVDPDSASVCYVTLSGYKIDLPGAHVYRTSDYGTTWQSIGGNLPDVPINDVLIDPADTRTLYVATDVGVMHTSDLGVAWSVLAEGMPSAVPCHDLVLHEGTRMLVVYTHGRSSFRIDLGSMTTVVDGSQFPERIALGQNYPNPFNGMTTISYDLPTGGVVSLIVYDPAGREVAVLVSGIIGAGRHHVRFDPYGLASGVYFYRLKAGAVSVTRKLIHLR
jgi:photosystem II stability/assembly factor-like uncharacterized protein